MKQYIVNFVSAKDSSETIMTRFSDLLNNPPKGYHVDNYFGISGDDETYRRYVVVYKLDDPIIETIKEAHRKFKGENDN